MPSFRDGENIDNFSVICRIGQWIGDGAVVVVAWAGSTGSCFSF